MAMTRHADLASCSIWKSSALRAATRWCSTDGRAGRVVARRSRCSKFRDDRTIWFASLGISVTATSDADHGQGLRIRRDHVIEGDVKGLGAAGP